jgi:hypothetical protein
MDSSTNQNRQRSRDDSEGETLLVEANELQEIAESATRQSRGIRQTSEVQGNASN